MATKKAQQNHLQKWKEHSKKSGQPDNESPFAHFLPHLKSPQTQHGHTVDKLKSQLIVCLLHGDLLHPLGIWVD